MKIDELVMHSTPGTIPGTMPFITKNAVTKIVPMNGVYVGLRPATMPIITMWNADPIKNEQTAELIGTAHLDNIGNGFMQIHIPTIDKESRGKGYGVLFYQYVLDTLKKNIQSDTEQTPGSALIWARLARDPKYKVYGVKSDGSEIPLIVDGTRLYYGDQTVYDSPIVQVMRCVRKK